VSGAALRVVQPPIGADLIAAEEAAGAFLAALGVDLDTESLAATPARMARRRGSRASVHDHAGRRGFRATTVTSALHGQLRSDAASRAEFFALIGPKSRRSQSPAHVEDHR
jgi:GTP cyclohydrolase I